MERFNFDSYCGNYCGACEIMSAYRNHRQQDVAAQWGVSPEEMECLGCKTEKVFKNCRICGIRRCAQEKGVDHCVSCPDFPCEILESGKGLVDKLPHLKAIPKNMKTIKEKGTEYWLNEQEKLWRCPNCGEPFSWYKEQCTRCGKDLRQDKDYVKIE